MSHNPTRKNCRNCRIIQPAPFQKNPIWNSIPVIAVLITTLPPAMYSAIMAYQLGHCFFYQIPFTSYLGLSAITPTMQIAFLCSFLLGIGLLNIVVYLEFKTNKRSCAVFIAKLFGAIIFGFIGTIKAFSLDFILACSQFSGYIVLLCCGLGIFIALIQRFLFKASEVPNCLQYISNNRQIQHFMSFTIIYCVILSLLFIIGFRSSVTPESYLSTTIGQTEYIVIFDSPQYYQLAAASYDEKLSKNTILLDTQLRIQKDGITVTRKNAKMYRVIRS